MEKKKKKQNKKRKKRILRRVFLVLFIVALLGAGGFFYVDSLAYRICRVEAGVEVEASDFMKNGDPDAFFTEDSGTFDITKPGEYPVKIKSGLFLHWCKLIVEDTVAPEGTAEEVSLEFGESCKADAFVSGITDATEVAVFFLKAPDFHKTGSQPVKIVLTDAGENKTELETTLFISPVKKELTKEAGSPFPALKEFLLTGTDARFLPETDNCNMEKPGDYTISIEVDGMACESVLHIIDTTAPQFSVTNVSGFAFVKRPAKEFVTSVQDVTNVTFSFAEEPDLSNIGTQEVKIVGTDEGGNTTEKTASLTLEEDTDVPVITGAADMIVYMGDAVAYKKTVKVEDSCPDDLTLTVDNSAVKLNEAGIYPVTYIARDAAGHEASVTVNLEVRERQYSLEEANALADAVLADILKDGMTPMEQVTAIYNYVVSHVYYTDTSVKGDWVEAAYEGLVLHRGDCYVYACTSKILLTRAGITNMDIEKIPRKAHHYWNLVDIGDGWHHFDTTPRKSDHPRILMWTEAELMEYSGRHYGSHNYDHTLYPEVP